MTDQSRSPIDSYPVVVARQCRANFLLELIDQGYDAFRFGPAGRPESVSQLVDAALDICTDRQRRIVSGRFVDRQTLKQLGGELDVTRERVRQIEQQAVDEFAERFGDVARRLTAPMREILDDHVPLVHADGLTPLADESDPGRLVLPLRIAGLDDVYRHDNTLITTLEATDRDNALRRFRDALQDLGMMRLDLDDAAEAARDVGFYDDTRAIAGLLEVAWDIQVIDGSFTLPWVSLTETVTNIVRQLGRPVSTEEIAEAYEEHRSKPGVDLKPLRGRDFQTKAQHSSEIYNYDHGVYVHIDNIPMARSDFEDAVEWAVDYLDGHTEQVSVESILDEMNLQRVAPAGLSPHLLKSALNRHPDTLSFKNTLLVAYTDTWIDSGMTMIDRLQEALLDYDEPVKVRQLCRDLSDYSYSIHSLRDTLLKKPWGMPMGRSRFLHAEKSGIAGDRLHALTGEIARQLPDDGSPVAAGAILDELNGDTAAPLRTRDRGPRILWALARGYADRIVAGTGELLAIDTGDTGKALFREAVYESLIELGIAYPRDVHDHLRSEYGFDGSKSSVSGTVGNLFDDGLAQRLPNSAYYIPGDTREQTFERWAERPDLIRQAARDEDTRDLPDDVRAAMTEFFTEWDPRPELVEGLTKRIVN